jgi:steroid 5-alpha reductase family enzyme
MFALFFLSDKWKVNGGAHWTHLAFLFIWTLHYGHRVFIYPLQIKNGKKMPLTVVLMGFLFNVSNAYIQGRWLFTLSDSTYAGDFLFPMANNYVNSWLYSPQFIVGVVIFLLGYYINKRSDVMLRALRKESNGNGYLIPNGFLYNRVSCPNYLGEIMEWIGWAILTWSLAGATFVIWTFANLFPRALSHHKWYKEEFDDYPEKRKAIIPFLL